MNRSICKGCDHPVMWMHAGLKGCDAVVEGKRCGCRGARPMFTYQTYPDRVVLRIITDNGDVLVDVSERDLRQMLSGVEIVKRFHDDVPRKDVSPELSEVIRLAEIGEGPVMEPLDAPCPECGGVGTLRDAIGFIYCEGKTCSHTINYSFRKKDAP